KPIARTPTVLLPLIVCLVGPKLALRAPRAIEGQLGRLVICEVGRKAILLFRPPHQSTLDTARDLNELLGFHAVGVKEFSPRPDPLRDRIAAGYEGRARAGPVSVARAR